MHAFPQYVHESELKNCTVEQNDIKLKKTIFKQEESDSVDSDDKYFGYNSEHDLEGEEEVEQEEEKQYLKEQQLQKEKQQQQNKQDLKIPKIILTDNTQNNNNKNINNNLNNINNCNNNLQIIDKQVQLSQSQQILYESNSKLSPVKHKTKLKPTIYDIIHHQQHFYFQQQQQPQKIEEREKQEDQKKLCNIKNFQNKVGNLMQTIDQQKKNEKEKLEQSKQQLQELSSEEQEIYKLRKTFSILNRIENKKHEHQINQFKQENKQNNEKFHQKQIQNRDFPLLQKDLDKFVKYHIDKVNYYNPQEKIIINDNNLQKLQNEVEKEKLKFSQKQLNLKVKNMGKLKPQVIPKLNFNKKQKQIRNTKNQYEKLYKSGQNSNNNSQCLPILNNSNSNQSQNQNYEIKTERTYYSNNNKKFLNLNTQMDSILGGDESFMTNDYFQENFSAISKNKKKHFKNYSQNYKEQIPQNLKDNQFENKYCNYVYSDSLNKNIYFNNKLYYYDHLTNVYQVEKNLNQTNILNKIKQNMQKNENNLLNIIDRSNSTGQILNESLCNNVKNYNDSLQQQQANFIKHNISNIKQNIPFKKQQFKNNDIVILRKRNSLEEGQTPQNNLNNINKQNTAQKLGFKDKMQENKKILKQKQISLKPFNQDYFNRIKDIKPNNVYLSKNRI